MEEMDLKELFSLVWSKKIVILIIIGISVIIGVIYSYFFKKVEYTASASLILVQSSTVEQAPGEESITTTDLNINSSLLSTYSELIKRDAVLSEVAYNLKKPEEEILALKNKISVTAVDDTQVLEINVTHEDPNYASEIANAIVDVFKQKVVEIYHISNVYELDDAEPQKTTDNISYAKDIIIFALIGLVISVGYILVFNMLDTTVKTEEDINRITKLVVLAAIPNYETGKGIKGGRR